MVTIFWTDNQNPRRPSDIFPETRLIGREKCGAQTGSALTALAADPMSRAGNWHSAQKTAKCLKLIAFHPRNGRF
jgi:hypothetical protein